MGKSIVDNDEKRMTSVADMVSAVYGGEKGVQYHNNVVAARDELVNSLNSLKVKGTAVDKLKGDLAEFWHGGTFNLNAAQRGSVNRVYVDRSNKLGSPDITSNFGKNYGLKYYENARKTAGQQAKSIFERYKEYQYNAKEGTTSLTKYMRENGYSQCNPNDPLYDGQVRIVPKDQLTEVQKYLESKIAKEASTRPDQVKRYQDTLKMLDDHLKDGEGTTSIPLSLKEAEELTRVAKEGGITPELLNLTDSEILRLEYIIHNAAKMGLKAAAVTAGITLILNFYKKYKEEGIGISDYTLEDWQDIFGTTLFSATTAGISATTLSIIGSYCTEAVPGVSAIVMAILGIASLVHDYKDGKLTKEQFIVEAEMVCFEAAIILLGTAVGNVAIPGLGGLIGAVAAKIAYYIIERFWGDELRELLNAINEVIESICEAIKSFFVDIWEKIVDFLKRIAEHIRMLSDKDFNYNLQFAYRREMEKYRQGVVKNQQVEVNKEAAYVRI